MNSFATSRILGIDGKEYFMKPLLLASLLALVSSRCFASDVVCEAWFQESGKALERNTMTLTSSSEKNTVYTASYRGYTYRVDWDHNLSTFYVLIEQSGSRILYTTARVPTDNHPENFTDLNLPGGPRLSVSCELK